MILKRKGDLMMLVVGMAAALVLLFVILFLYNSKFGIFRDNINDCQSKGAVCVKSIADCESSISQFSCPKNTPVCCMKPGE